MKPLFIIGNWKSNKNIEEATNWVQEADTLLAQKTIDTNKTVVMSVPFTLLPTVSNLIQEKSLTLHVGAQDVSQFPHGAYTGAINAEQVKAFATHVIIGHSERRRFFNETDEILAQKVVQSLAVNLIPIYLVQSENEPIPQGVAIVGYEPVSAIGTGTPETPENAQQVAKAIKEKNPFVSYVLYGGSVTADNVASFTSLADINGVIPGGASLTPESFLALVHNA